MDFIWPVQPAAQPLGGNRAGQVGKWAVFVAGNGFISQTYLRCCPCGVLCFQDSAGQWYYSQFANFVTAMLGLVLVLGQIAYFKTVFTSQAYVTVAQWLVSLAKVASVGTLQLWVNVFYICLRTLYCI
uniref:Uncharacterized protein n=1 Tax=Leersia perrieri TaxID=77586 RepID=A0A0D9X8L2_9ORYZ